MNSPQILIVDDEPNVRFVLENSLKHEGYEIDMAQHGAEALQKITQTTYDLILLDLQMSPIDGLQVLQAARDRDNCVTVIILTAHSSVESAVEALRWGAFDYLLKPTSPENLRKRVAEGLSDRQQNLYKRRLLHQMEQLRQTFSELDDAGVTEITSSSTRFVTSGKLVIDRHHRQATLDNELLDLTSAEFDILLCLVKAAPQPLSPRELVNSALGYDSDETKAREVIKWHIHHLRRKVEPEPTTPCYIKTVRYKGYMWRG